MEIEKKETESNIFERINILFKKYEKTWYLVMGICSGIFSYIKFQNEKKIDNLNLKNEFEIRCIKIEQQQLLLIERVDTYGNALNNLENRLEYLDRKETTDLNNLKEKFYFSEQKK
jgi:hypothetical protein